MIAIFDFDGVIVRDSEFFKEEAWKIVFAPYAGRYEPILEEARNEKFGFGKAGDRYDMFRHVYRSLGIKESKIESCTIEGAKVFNDYVQKKIVEAGVVEGGRELLVELSAKKQRLYVNSGTAIDALAESVCALKLDKYFNGIFGGPASKIENLHKISAIEKVSPPEILLVGDSYGDARVAKEFGCRFVGVTNTWNKAWDAWPHEPKPEILVAELKKLKDYM